jgi:hypothetical protein
MINGLFGQPDFSKNHLSLRDSSRELQRYGM